MILFSSTRLLSLYTQRLSPCYSELRDIESNIDRPFSEKKFLEKHDSPDERFFNDK